MKQTIIFSCITFLLGIFCAQLFHTQLDYRVKTHPANQQEKINTPNEQLTSHTEKTLPQQNLSVNTAIKPSPQANTITQAVHSEKNAIESRDTTQQKLIMDSQLYEQFKDTLKVLQSSQNESDRLLKLDTLFEKAKTDPARDSASALTLSDVFREDKQLAAYIPQSIQCHTNTCKLELPINDQAQTEQMLEILSAKIKTQDLPASQIFAANNEDKGTVQLYVSLTDTQNNF